MEHRMQRYRERQLEVPGEEEEEVEEELEEEEEQIQVIGETEKTVEGASGGTQAADGGDSPAQVARDRKSRSRTRSRSGYASFAGRRLFAALNMETTCRTYPST